MSRLLHQGRKLVYFGQGVGGVYVASERQNETLPILYSDAATSCLICYCCGPLEESWGICYAHVDSSQGIREFFRKVKEIFGGCGSSLDLYASGAVDYTIPNKNKNYGKQIFDTLNTSMNEYNCAQNEEISIKPHIQFHTPHKVFQDHQTFAHYYGFDLQTKTPLDDYIPIDKEGNIEEIGAHCILFGLNREPIYWMDNSFRITEIPMDLYTLQYFATRSLDEEEMKNSSTTPDIEPKEYYQNSKAGILYARALLRQIQQRNS